VDHIRYNLYDSGDITYGIIYFMDLVHRLIENHGYQGQARYLLSDYEYRQNLLGH